MGLLSAVKTFFGDNPLSKAVDRVVDRILPETLSEVEREDLRRQMHSLEHDIQMDLEQVAREAEAVFNERIAQLEGTANDLKSLPILGPIVLFLRGVQRPLWGFAALAMDWLWFSGQWDVGSEQQQTALIVINTLVLGFLFGERTVRNLSPLITQVFGKRHG